MILFVKKEYDYAIRICAYLAGYYQSGPISMAKISQKLFITRPFTTKIVYQLKSSGIVETVQGKDGGVYLNQSPTQLTLYDILTGMGSEQSISECIQRKDFCPLPPPCTIHSYFIRLEDQLIQELKTHVIGEFSFTDSDFDPGKVKL